MCATRSPSWGSRTARSSPPGCTHGLRSGSAIALMTARARPPTVACSPNHHPKGAVMAICLIVENPDQTADQADRVMAHVRSSGPVPPEGARLVIAGPANPGWRVISIWESQEALERFFAERLGPAYQEAGLTFERVQRTIFDVHMLVAGDLVGQPA